MAITYITFLAITYKLAGVQTYVKIILKQIFSNNSKYSNEFYIQQYRACCLYRLKNATSGPRDAEYFDDVLHSYTSINLTLGIILGVILLTTIDIPHYGKLSLINAFKFYFICKLFTCIK